MHFIIANLVKLSFTWLCIDFWAGEIYTLDSAFKYFISRDFLVLNASISSLFGRVSNLKKDMQD